MRTITLPTARRLFIQRQRLNDPNPANDAAGILDVVRDLGCLQLDPISAVARSHQLVVRSRVGNYDLAALDQLLWTDRSLFEYWAHMASIVLTEDYPIHALLMRTYARDESTGKVSQRYQQWLTVNQQLKRHILQELKRTARCPRGSLKTKPKKTRAGIRPAGRRGAMCRRCWIICGRRARSWWRVDRAFKNCGI